MTKIHSFGIAPYIVINGSYFFLLNKSSKSSYYNFFKGKQNPGESKEETAIREFFEETGVLVNKEDLEEYFFQQNLRKNIGIYILDWTKYYKSTFTFQKEEIWSASWVNISEQANFSKNQQEIWEKLILFFKAETKKLNYKYF